MICNCGEKCFNYERITKTENNKLLKERVYKCGTFKESSKKEKCNFFNVEKIETVIDKYSIPDVIKEKEIMKKDKTEELHKYINLYEKTREKKITNIESLINFNLKLNGYDLFFEENETIEQLKDRIKRTPEKNIKPNTVKNLVLVEVPEKLRVTITNKRKLKTPGTYYFSSGYINFRNEDDESDIDEDNCFDIDNFSDDEENNFNEEYYD
tara:strand:- start:2956 stop:3588 length:633 start_codon:yes stop_codon:yes gene_type:complete